MNDLNVITLTGEIASDIKTGTGAWTLVREEVGF